MVRPWRVLYAMLCAVIRVGRIAGLLVAFVLGALIGAAVITARAVFLSSTNPPTPQ